MKQSRLSIMLLLIGLGVGCAWRPSANLPLSPSARVRITTGASADSLVLPPVEGTLLRVDRETIVLELDDDGAEWTVVPMSGDSLHVLQRRSNTLRGAAIGLALGIGSGAVLGAASFRGSGNSGDAWDLTPAEGAIVVGIVGGVGGLVVGTILGVLMSSERWTPVALGKVPISVTGLINGTLTVRVRMPLSRVR